MRRAKSLRNGVHHANAVVWEPVYSIARREARVMMIKFSSRDCCE